VQTIIRKRTAVTANRNIRVDEQNSNITPRALQLPIINLPQTKIQDNKNKGGPFQTAAMQIHNAICCNVKSINPNEKLLTKEREIENFDNDKILPVEDQQREQIVNQTHARDFNGQFISRSPLKLDPPNIGVTKELALKGFYALEGKFKTDSNFKTHYQIFMQEYISLNHMLLAVDDDRNEGC
jgi:hypothetical protein